MHPWVSIAITCCQRGCQETRTASPPYREWFGTCACRNNQTTLRFIMGKNLRTNTNIIWTNIHHMFLHHMCVSYHVSISLHSCFLPELLTTCLEVPKYRWMLGGYRVILPVNHEKYWKLSTKYSQNPSLAICTPNIYSAWNLSCQVLNVLRGFFGTHGGFGPRLRKHQMGACEVTKKTEFLSCTCEA